MKRLIILSGILIFLGGNACFAGEEHFGKHTGELKDLSIEVVYTNYFGKTPDGYVIYYIGGPMSYELHIRNNSPRTYNHLDISAIQEYYESGTCDRWWYPHPRIVTYTKGEAMPGDSTDEWKDVVLRGNEEIVLSGGYTPPLATCDGLDQTHVVIKHMNKGKVDAAIMYWNPECGVFCPPPPK